MTREALGELVETHLRDIPDFPTPGILFRDITPVVGEPAVFRAIVDYFGGTAKASGATVIGGIEARGFILAAPVAYVADARFVPLRKAGKLPGPTHELTYDLEYGSAALEIQVDAIRPGDRVVILDDILATGGTAAAACDLVEEAGGAVIETGFLMELAELAGRGRLEGRTVDCLVSA